MTNLLNQENTDMGSCNVTNTHDPYPKNLDISKGIGSRDCFKDFLKYIANALKISYIIGCQTTPNPIITYPDHVSTMNIIKINNTFLPKKSKPIPDPYNYLGYVGEIKPGLKIVVFRGTLGKKVPPSVEWDQDLDSAILVPLNSLKQGLFKATPNAKVGQGFLNLFGKSYYTPTAQNLTEHLTVYGQLSQFLKTGDKVIFCGHSLGCAVAYLAALWFQNYSNNDNFMVVNFAPPKVCGNAEFCDMFKNCLGVFNIINEADIVPRAALPLSKATQCCNVIYYDKKNTEIRDNHSLINYYNNSNLWGTKSYTCQPPPNKNLNMSPCPSLEKFSLFGNQKISQNCTIDGVGNGPDI